MKKFFSRVKTEKLLIENHIYYSWLFVVIFSVHFLHLWVMRSQLSFSLVYYGISALLQSLMEVAFLIFLGKVIKRYCSSKLYHIYVVMTFLVAAIHLIDFPLVRLMDMSIWFIFRFLSHETLDNYLELLYATNVSLITWFVSIGACLAVIVGSIVLYKFLEKHSIKRPIAISYRRAFLSCMIVPSALIMWNTAFVDYIEEKEHLSFVKGLPWKGIFGRKEGPTIALDMTKTNLSEEEMMPRLESMTLEKKPDIFLFIAESIREDFITCENTPNLFGFKKEASFFSKTVAGGNYTQGSWYSIFYSKPTVFWGLEESQGGNFYLKYLKEKGYEIHILSSARLAYYQMDKLLLGRNLSLADELELFRTSEEISAYESDRMAIEKLCSEIKKTPSAKPRVFIVFLDATHFGYSFPQDKTLPFQPCPEKINYLQAALSKECIPGVVTRYRNALFFLDELFGKFLAQLKQSPSWKESIVVFTGDHGEEFYERGHLFHSSNLSRQQIRVPLFIKLPDENICPQQELLSSHLDIMPTLFHALTKDSFVKEAFYGRSLLIEDKNRIISSARYNASMNPDEFVIQEKGVKIVLRKKSFVPITQCKLFEIVSVTDEEDNPLFLNPQEIYEKIERAHKSLFLQKVEA